MSVQTITKAHTWSNLTPTSDFRASPILIRSKSAEGVVYPVVMVPGNGVCKPPYFWERGIVLHEKIIQTGTASNYRQWYAIRVHKQYYSFCIHFSCLDAFCYTFAIDNLEELLTVKLFNGWKCSTRVFFACLTCCLESKTFTDSPLNIALLITLSGTGVNLQAKQTNKPTKQNKTNQQNKTKQN